MGTALWRLASSWSNTTPTVLQLGQAGVSLPHVHVCGSRITSADSLVWLPGFNRITEHRSHLAASPPGRKFDTLGLPSLSDPPEMVRPRLLPSLFIRSTVVTPRYSSADRYRHRHRSTVSISVCLTESPCLKGNERLFSLSLSWIAHWNALWRTTTYFIFSLSCLFLVPLNLSIWLNLCDRFRRRRKRGTMESVLLISHSILIMGGKIHCMRNSLKIKLKSNCIHKWMKMSLTLTLMDMWLYSVIRGLIVSCGSQCAALLHHSTWSLPSVV